MGRYRANKVDSKGKVIKNLKEWKTKHPNELYHDSKLEYDFYHILKKRKIKFDHKVIYTLQPSFKFKDYVKRNKAGVSTTDWFDCKIQPITWSPDFLLTDYNIVLECKGKIQETFPNKLKMFKHYVHVNKLDLRVVVIHKREELEKFLDNGLNG
jgi:hypothetical protein